MKITCESCGTRYSLPDQKIQGSGRTFKIRCKNCGDMMSVRGVDGATPEAAPPSVEPGWYYAVGADRRGPVTRAELEAARDGGELTGTSYVWRKGMAGWQHAAEVEELAGLLSAAAEATPAEEAEEPGDAGATHPDAGPLGAAAEAAQWAGATHDQAPEAEQSGSEGSDVADGDRAPAPPGAGEPDAEEALAGRETGATWDADGDADGDAGTTEASEPPLEPDDMGRQAEQALAMAPATTDDDGGLAVAWDADRGDVSEDATATVAGGAPGDGEVAEETATDTDDAPDAGETGDTRDAGLGDGEVAEETAGDAGDAESGDVAVTGEVAWAGGSETTADASEPFGAPDVEGVGRFEHGWDEPAAGGEQDDGPEDDDIFGLRDDGQAATYSRRETSVLFSLDELDGDDPRAKPADDELVTETSGLIDIRAIAKTQVRPALTSADDPFADLGVAAPLMPISSAAVAAPPLVQKRSSTLPWVLLGLMVACFVGGGVWWLFFASPEIPAPQPLSQPQVAQARAVAAASSAGAPVTAHDSVAPKGAAKAETGGRAESASAAASDSEEAPEPAAGAGAKGEAGAEPAAGAEASTAEPAQEAAEPPAEGGDEPRAATVDKPKPATEPRHKPEPKPKPVTKPEPKAEAKPEPKPEAKPEVKPAPKAVVEPAPEDEPSPASANTRDVNDLLRQLNRKDDGGTGGTSADDSVPKRLSASVVRSTLKRRRGQFGQCRKLMGDAEAGAITVGTSFAILSSGTVSSARVVSSGGASGAVQACIVRTLKGVRFPAFSDPQMTVNYPIQLR